jgi:two-component system OmpR family response regulator
MAKQIKKNRIFSALEVANICGVVNQTAINWIKSNYLKAFTTPGGQYRVYADDLVDFLNGRNMRIPDELSSIVAAQSPSVSFLVIDDDRDLNDLVSRQLVRHYDGATVNQAFDGFEAGSMAIKLKPKVVILDLNLPGVDGKTICKNIKGDPSFNDPIVIVVSGADDEETKESVLAEGAEAFIAKPVDTEELLETIAAHLDR